MRQAPSTANRKVVCTFLPVYVFALNVVGDTPGVEVELLVSPEVGCPHSYSVRPADLQRVERADVVIANGLGLEGFLGKLIQAGGAHRVVTISDDCDVLPRRGQHEYDHASHDTGETPVPHHTGYKPVPQAEDEHEDVAHEGELNPHVWVSPAEAIVQVRTLARKLGESDPEHATRYQQNADAYVARLETLRARVNTVAASLTRRKIVTFHDAFDYLARDLGLEVVATLMIEPEQMPSAGQIRETIDRIKAEGAAAIFAEPAYSARAAETVSRETGVPVFELNPFNTMTGPVTPDAYERVMSRNLDVLEQALGN
ncbi:MAG: metal ABC transporter substrate-binding protein [Gemmatimonadetes bacterium]|nr:metal ABC transporter substrate-binding protein [Gemmatimonadota bacterium]